MSRDNRILSSSVILCQNININMNVNVNVDLSALSFPNLTILGKPGTIID